MNDLHIVAQLEDSSPSPGKKDYRTSILKLALYTFFALVCGRLLQIQIIESARYREMADKQYQARIPLPASRGSILDRNGNVLASNSMSVSFAADPRLAADEAQSIAETFSAIFGKPKSYYLQKLDTESKFAWLERQVGVEYLQRVKSENFTGLVVRYEPKRLYHNDYVAGQLLGSTNVDYNGDAGIECQFNTELRGKDGYVVFQRDGSGHARPAVDYPRVEPMNGNDVYLTLDLNVQSIAEEELKKGIIASQAEAGLVVMIQPSTGEVIALAQYPSVNPNAFSASAQKDQRLRAATDVFEPGSVFKLVTASAALEADVVKPAQRFYAEEGKYVVAIGGGKTRTIEDTHPYGWITFQEAMEFSSNIVMAKVSDILGAERLYKMARDYGFGMLTNIEYPGEVKGILKKPMDWYGTTLNTMAFGYEVGVTPLQIAVAYCAVANGGMIVRPHILKKEVDPTGQLVRESSPEMIRKVISPPTVRTLQNFFEGVVERGTAKPARVEGVRIAGKTGTSRKYVEGGYEPKSYTASFVGYFPADNPQLVCLVMMDNPRGVNYTGGTTSAPIFRAIAERVLTTTQFLAPPEQSATKIASAGASQDVPQGDDPPARSTLVGTAAASVISDTLVPDVRGFSARRAVSLLSMAQLDPVVKGSGIVVRQQPLPGMPFHARMKVVLTCQPRALESAARN